MEMILLLELLGTCAFSLAGSLMAIQCGLDIFGVIFCGAITASGGGILRDITMGNIPPVFFTDKIYFIFSLITSLIVFLLAYTNSFYQKVEEYDKVINIVDAIGLGTFTLVGVHIVIESAFGDNMFLAVMMGMITGCGGGLLRDLLISRIPTILRKRVYALASIIGAIIYYLLLQLTDARIAIVAGFLSIFLIRYCAYRYKWNLPVVKRQ